MLPWLAQFLIDSASQLGTKLAFVAATADRCSTGKAACASYSVAQAPRTLRCPTGSRRGAATRRPIPLDISEECPTEARGRFLVVVSHVAI